MSRSKVKSGKPKALSPWFDRLTTLSIAEGSKEWKGEGPEPVKAVESDPHFQLLFRNFFSPLTIYACSFLLILLFAMTPDVKAETVTLQEGLSAVISKGYEMRIATAREAAAAKGEVQARARLRPQINAYADHTWLSNRPEAIFGTGSTPLSDDRFLRYGVTVKQLLTDFGRTGSSIKAARAGARGQIEETVRMRNTAALNYIMAYVSLLQAEKALKLANLEVQRFESYVTDAKALHTAGEVTLNDVLVAVVALADATLRRITIQDERNLAVSNLNYLILRSLDNPTIVVDFPFHLDPVPDLEDASIKASANRPDLKIFEERIIAKNAELSSSKALSYPTFFVGGGYAFEENPYRVHEDNWSAMAGLTWELYTGGAHTAGRKRVMDELAALIAQKEQVKELVNLEVRDSHRLLTGTIERTSVTQKAVTQAKESLRLQRSRYTEGEATATEVTDAVTSLARAEDNHWTAIYGRLKAEARLLYATGDDLVTIYSRSRSMTPDDSLNTETGEEK
jgi:outer membrane protein TolC